jgi:cellulose synthase/poly-beta-1,6-N-acetylglucosamine synthase-like glycosyltransferase
VIYFWWISGLILAAIWFSRVLDAALGMPTIADLARPEWDRPASSNSKISMIVPARNEEEMIGKTLPTMLRQDYQNYEVIAIDDRSTDLTGEIIDRIASSYTAGQDGPSLKVIHISELPTDWMGKPHAMWVGAQQATGDWLLFTDADITFSPDCLRRAVAYAEESKTDHLVLIPTLIMLSVGERMMLAFFNILFVFGHRPWKVADPRTKDHMGVGAFNLIRRTVYDQVGTHAKLRFEVLDDVKLGKIVKENGFTQRVALGRNLISLRWAKNAMDVVRNLTKNFFALMQFRWPRALGSCLLLAFFHWMPFLGIFLAPGWSRVGYALALLSIFLIYVGLSWTEPISPLYFILHPVAGLLFMYIMLRSTTLTLWRDGVVWRGTFYPLNELRRGLV